MSANHAKVTRRDFLKLGAVGTSAVAASSLAPWLSACSIAAEETVLNVLVPAVPDPAPPGVAKFSEEAFANGRPITMSGRHLRGPALAATAR